MAELIKILVDSQFEEALHWGPQVEADCSFPTRVGANWCLQHLSCLVSFFFQTFSCSLSPSVMCASKDICLISFLLYVYWIKELTLCRRHWVLSHYIMRMRSRLWGCLIIVIVYHIYFCWVSLLQHYSDICLTVRRRDSLFLIRREETRLKKYKKKHILQLLETVEWVIHLVKAHINFFFHIIINWKSAWSKYTTNTLSFHYIWW